MAKNCATSFKEGWLEIAPDARLYYRDYGATNPGTPILCLHGYWRTSRDYEELADHLTSQGRRTILMDLRGRGQSSWFPVAEDYHFDHVADDVVALLDALGIEKAVFVGLVLGGQIAMRLAAAQPERVAGIVLNDTGPEANISSGGKMKAFATSDAIDRAEAMRRVRGQYAEACPHFGEEEFERILYRNYRQDGNGTYVRDFDPLTHQELGRMIREKATFWDEFRQIRDVPVTVLRGENSTFLTPAIVDRMLEVRPETTLVTIAGCGHPVMLWEAEAFTAVDALLARAEEGAVSAARA